MHGAGARKMSGMERMLISLALVSLVACSSSHALEEDGGLPPLADAGLSEDAAAPLDAGRPITSCTPESFALRGEGCFCSGPIALYGEALYRQAIGIEVYDLSDPVDPRLVTTVEERAGSEGGLALLGAHLVSVTNFAPLQVYSLADPLAPALVGSLELPASARGIAIEGERAIVAMDGTEGSLLGLVDLRDPTAPRVEGSIPLPDVFVQGPVRVSAGSAWLMGHDRSESFSGEPVLVELELATREVTVRALGDESSSLSGFDVEGSIAVTVAFEQPLRVYAIEPGALREIGSLEPGPELSYATSVELRAGLALTAGNGLVIVDLSDPTRPRTLGASPAASGAWIASTESHAYVSSGNGVMSFVLGCE